MYKVIRSIEINHRNDFSLLCNLREVRVAVEVGTDRGVFAKSFMERFQGEELICVDSYTPYEELTGVRTPDMLMAVLALMPWHGRVRMMQTTSREAAENFPWWLINRCDFVYIDAQHDYESVMEDMNLWWDLLTPQGILAGHDYDETHPDVKKAVQDFAKEKDLIVRIVQGDHPESWYAYKTEPAELKKAFFSSITKRNIHYKED